MRERVAPLEQQRAHRVLVPVRPEEGRVCQHVHLRPGCGLSRGERLSCVPGAARSPERASLGFEGCVAYECCSASRAGSCTEW